MRVSDRRCGLGKRAFERVRIPPLFTIDVCGHLFSCKLLRDMRYCVIILTAFPDLPDINQKCL